MTGSRDLEHAGITGRRQASPGPATSPTRTAPPRRRCPASRSPASPSACATACHGIWPRRLLERTGTDLRQLARETPGRVGISAVRICRSSARMRRSPAPRVEAPGDTVIGELVDGHPARAFTYTAGGSSRRSAAEIAFWAMDRIPVTSRLDIDAAVRAASTTASRAGSPAHIPWRSLSPGIQGTWRAIPNGRLTLVAGYAKYSSRLPLDYLAWGDPNSLSGSVHTWIDANGDRVPQAGEIGALVAPVGPCCAGGQANTIDPDLRPPYTNEFLLGHPHAPGQPLHAPARQHRSPAVQLDRAGRRRERAGQLHADARA